MSYTRGGRSAWAAFGRRSDRSGPPADRRTRPCRRGRAVCFTSLLLGTTLTDAGCVIDRPVLSPRFPELVPLVVAVTPVENETTRDLTNETSAGIVQQFVLGKRGVDVPATLREALADGLAKKGYPAQLLEPGKDEPDYRAPLPAGKSPGFDALLYTTIT